MKGSPAEAGYGSHIRRRPPVKAGGKIKKVGVKPTEPTLPPENDTVRKTLAQITSFDRVSMDRSSGNSDGS